MLRTIFSGCVGCILLIAIHETAPGQVGMGGSSFSGNSFGTGRSGGFGTSAFGTGGLGSVNFGSGGFGGQSAFGSGGFGSSSFGSGGFGNVGSGGGFGTGGFGSGSMFGGQGPGGGMYGAGQGGQNFVGRDSGDMAAVMQQMNRSGQQFMQEFGRAMNRGGRNRNRETDTGENAPPPVRVVLDVAFPHPQVPIAAVAIRLQGRLERILLTRNIARPEVAVAGDTVVLRGVAKDESERLVIERLVAMEPGVLKVDNQMTVALVPNEGNPAATGSLP